MPFVFNDKDFTVRDVERGIVMKIVSSTFGENGERGGGWIAHLNWPQEWGDNQVSAWVFFSETFPTPNSVNLHHKLNLIYIPDPIKNREKEIVAILEETFQNFPGTNSFDVINKITTDFSTVHLSVREITRF